MDGCIIYEYTDIRYIYIGLTRVLVCSQAINLISAPAFAAEREITVTHSLDPEPGRVYAALLKLKVDIIEIL